MFSTAKAYVMAGVSIFTILAMALLYLDNRATHAKLDAADEWKQTVVTAARAAAHNPNLGEKYVAGQVLTLGADLDKLIAAQKEAERLALAAKQEKERHDEEKRKKADDALPIEYGEARRRADAYRVRHRLRPAGPPDISERDPVSGDLPEPSFTAPQSDGPGNEAELVAITAADLNTCSLNTVRLENAQQWASTLTH